MTSNDCYVTSQHLQTNGAEYVVTIIVQNNFYNFISVHETEPQNLDFVIGSAMR